MPEYKRQWVVDLKRKGLWKEPNRDSLHLSNIEDSIKIIKDGGKLLDLARRRDSLKVRLMNAERAAANAKAAAQKAKQKADSLDKVKAAAQNTNTKKK